MSNRSSFPLVERLYPGELVEQLRTWRKTERRSFEDIAYLIRETTGVQRSAKTVERWFEANVDPDTSLPDPEGEAA